MTADVRGDRLRAILAGTQCIAPACVFDPLSARLAEDIGFEAMLLAGSVASATVLGAPDDNVITLTELCAQVRRICRAANLPLIVDADHGFGNERNVRRTVEELEAAGAAAMLLEDTLLPAPFGASAEQMIGVEEAVAKIRAARAARSTPGIVIVGRSIALAAGGVDAAVSRARAYEAAGAEALFFGRLTTRGELDALAAASTVPLVLGKVPPDLNDPAYLAARRVRILVPGHEAFLAALGAVDATLRALRGGIAPAELTGLPSAELLERVLRR